ncbi:MAG: protein translocase subunit SecD [Coriobacteriales bacterium]|nr:protein translocase subunit SecD [Coriobacteriales bacterium]
MADRRFKPKKRPAPVRNHAILLILLAVLLIGSFIMFVPPQDKIKQGLDVQGGLSIVMQASKVDGSGASGEELEAARQIVERRINLLGASEASVQVQGDNQLLVQIPGTVDQTQALSTIGQTGVLEFVNLAEVANQADVQTLQSGTTLAEQQINEMLAFGQIDPAQLDVELSGNRAPAGMYSVNEVDLGNGSTYTTYHHLTLAPGSYTAIFTGADIESVQVGRENEKANVYYSVNLKLNATATQAFGEVTTQLAPTKGKIAILLDGAIQSAPAVQSAITTGDVAITGNYSLQDANALKTVLESGSLPVTLTVITSQAIGPTLGQESLASGVFVAIIGLVLVAVYLVVFYKGIGLLTSAAVIIFALLYLGVLATLSFFGQFALSLAGIAGIVLAIGVAADSSILVLERFKEEIRMGRSVRAASITGVKHAIETSIDADLVALVSALALFFIAVGSTKGFGLTLALGVVCDIATMLLFKAPLIRLLAPRIITRHPGFWGVKEDEQIALAAGELNRGDLDGQTV